MTYDFRNLSPADFEDLVLDLIGRELGVRFETFSTGPDGGIDGRHSIGETIVLQAKHFAGSSYSNLKSAMKKERAAIDRLQPQRYVLTTSLPLTPKNKAELHEIVGPSLLNEADIFNQRDLNGLLRKFPDIQKSHLKLWLSSSAVLDSIVNAASHAFNNITKDEIASKVRVYAPNPSLREATQTLASQHIVIISGPPGVGKTTLAEMLAYTHIAEGWELAAIRNLDDGFASISDAKKQIFLFDDFLGKIALDKRALAHTDSDLARFIRRVRGSPNARFILTTRAYIFEEARRVSEHLADHRLDIAKYLLDVGIYTRRIKARILYNHLLVAGTPKAHVFSLVRSDKIPKIVDHQHYNPRIIEWMTDAAHLDTVPPERYPSDFLEMLAHPSRLWDIAFRTHISKPCQHVLFCLFFGSEYGVNIEALRLSYDALHPILSAKYGDPHDPKDFEESLRILEGSFVTISTGAVNFVNPSLRDYLDQYLNDLGLLSEFAKTANETSWARSLWRHGSNLNASQEQRVVFVQAFLDIASAFLWLPTFTTHKEDFVTYRSPSGLSNIRRIELLLEWGTASEDSTFFDLALRLAAKPVGGFDALLDGSDVVSLTGKLRDSDYYGDIAIAAQLSNLLEHAAINLINNGMNSDELENMSDEVERWREVLHPALIDAMDDAIRYQVRNVRDIISDEDLESTLDSHAETLKKLGERANVEAQALETAITAVKERAAMVSERTSDADSPSVSDASFSERDAFTDTALKNLFAPLAQED